LDASSTISEHVIPSNKPPTIVVDKSVTVIPFGHTEQIAVDIGTGDGVGPNKLSGNRLSV